MNHLFPCNCSSDSGMMFSRILQDILENCSAQNCYRNVPRYRIVLLGQTGSGKTCFFNSLNSSIHGFVTNQAAVGLANGGLASTLFQEYDILSPIDNKPLGVSITDTKGFRDDLSDVLCAVDGGIHQQWQFGIRSAPRPCTSEQHQQQSAHCCVLVIDAPSVPTMTDEMWENYQILQRAISVRGIPVVVLLTQIDLVPNGNQGNRDVFYNEPIRDIVRTISMRLANIPLNRIYPVKNYGGQYMINSETSTLILLAFREMLRLCERNACYLFQTWQRHSNWREKFEEWLPQNTKHRIIVLICLSVLVCLIILRPTIIWRRSMAAIMVGLLSDWCLFAGFGDYTHFDHLFDEHEEGEEGDEHAHDHYEEDDYYQ